MQAVRSSVLNQMKGVKSLATGFESTRSQHEAISSVVLDHWWNPPLNPEMHFVAGSDCCHRPNQHLKSKQPQTEEAEVRQLWLGFMSACYQVKGFPLKNRVLMIKRQSRGKQEKSTKTTSGSNTGRKRTQRRGQMLHCQRGVKKKKKKRENIYDKGLFPACVQRSSTERLCRIKEE